MKVLIEKRFVKDSKRLSSEAQKNIASLIEKLEKSNTLEKFDITKIQGYEEYFRIRVGDYRVGLRIKDGQIILVRIAKRDEIYKIFP